MTIPQEGKTHSSRRVRHENVRFPTVGIQRSCKVVRRLRRMQHDRAGAAVAEGKSRPRDADRCGNRNPAVQETRRSR